MNPVNNALPTDFLAGQDLENWPTRTRDQEIALEVLKRHNGLSEFVWLLEGIDKVGDADGGAFQVTFPTWVQELEQEFNTRYGNSTGWIITQKTLRWLIRTVFRERAIVTVQ